MQNKNTLQHHMIWDITLKTSTPIKRIGNYGFSFARFTSDGNRLFTADLSTTFRVWNPSDYTFEKWSNLKSPCNSACWSPNGKILLYSCSNSSILYSLQFYENNRQETKIIYDLKAITLYEQNNEYRIGGDINNICWDSNGERLAVSFKKYEMDFYVNTIAVFITKTNSTFQAMPCGIIRDVDNAWPATLQFKPNFDQGSLLAIAWSNGRVQYVPFYYSKPDCDNDESSFKYL